jgi:hypothetical protein
MNASPNAAKLQQVRLWSRLAANGCAAAAVLFVVAVVYRWLSGTPESLATLLDLPHVSLTPTRRLASLALSILPIAVITWGVLRLRASFLCFARDELFSAKAIDGLRDFAAAGVGSVVIAAIVSPAVSLVLTAGTPLGAEVSIKIGTGSVMIVLISSVTWIFAHVLGLSAALAEENASLAEENAAFV